MMTIFKILLIVSFLVIMIKEVVIPVWYGTPLFPFFRHKKLLNQLQEAKDEVDSATIEKEVVETKAKAKGIRSKTKSRTN